MNKIENDINDITEIILAMTEKIKTLNERQDKLEEIISTLSSGVVDVHFKSQSQIYIVSKLGKGYFAHIAANFENYNDLTNFVKDVKKQYGIHDINIV